MNRVLFMVLGCLLTIAVILSCSSHNAQARITGTTDDDSRQTVTRAAVSHPAEYVIPHLKHYYQTWNNCGPASLSMVLSAYGIDKSQEEIRRKVRPDPGDKHTAIRELIAYAHSLGLYATQNTDGTGELIKLLLTSNIPVMLKIGLDPENEDWMCHYIIISGYSDKRAGYIVMDSLYGPSVFYGYKKLSVLWSHFMWTYVVFAPRQKQQKIKEIIDSYRDIPPQLTRLQQRVYGELTANPTSGFAWYNVARYLLLTGRCQAAAAAIKKAYKAGLPWRLPWYDTSMYEIYFRIADYDDIMAVTGRILRRNPFSEEAWYYRARVALARHRTDEARAELHRALEINPYYADAERLLAEIEGSS
jgi:tetratricopeptide (TPR) repeat protein